MDPLSVTASVVAILQAASSVISILSDFKEASPGINAVITEVKHVRLVVSALQSYVDRSRQLRSGRAALVQVDDVVAVLTQTVLVFSELEATFFVSRKSKNSNLFSRLGKQLAWTWQQGGINRLVDQLQEQKLSLNLLLQIMQWYVGRGCVHCPMDVG